MTVREDLQVIDEFLAEGKEYLAKGDTVQASEKLYKAVEECIKLLAEKEKLPEYEEARREGRWWSRLLLRAARNLAQRKSEEKIFVTWALAFDELHIWGFHEKALSVEHVRLDVPHVEWLANYTKEALDKREN